MGQVGRIQQRAESITDESCTSPCFNLLYPPFESPPTFPYTTSHSIPLSSSPILDDCAQGNLLRGWDASFVTSSSQSRSKIQQMPDAVRVFSGCSTVPPPNSGALPTMDDTAAIYQDIPTIIVHKGPIAASSSSQGAGQYGSHLQPMGPVKRTM